MAPVQNKVEIEDFSLNMRLLFESLTDKIFQSQNFVRSSLIYLMANIYDFPTSYQLYNR